MRQVTTILLLVLATGCKSPPDEGDIYENKLTKERIEIARVGTCSDLEYFYEGYNDHIGVMVERGDYSTGIAITLAVMPSARYSPSDSLSQCFAYEYEDAISAPGGSDWIIDGKRYGRVPVTMAAIEPLSVLESDYTKVE